MALPTDMPLNDTTKFTGRLSVIQQINIVKKNQNQIGSDTQEIDLLRNKKRRRKLPSPPTKSKWLIDPRKIW